MKKLTRILLFVIIFSIFVTSCRNGGGTQEQSRTENATTTEVGAPQTSQTSDTEASTDGTETTDSTAATDGTDGTETTEGNETTEGTESDGKTEPTQTTERPVTTEPPHSHSYTKTVVPPTKTGYGYTVYTCGCGDSYESDYVSQLAPAENSEFFADFSALADKKDYFSYFVSESGSITDLKELTKAVYGKDCEGWGGTGNGIALESEDEPSHFILRDDNDNGELTFSGKEGKLRVLAFKAPVDGSYSYAVNIRLWSDDNKDKIRVLIYRESEPEAQLKNVGLNKDYQLINGTVYLEEGEYLYAAITTDKGYWNYGAIQDFAVSLDQYAVFDDGLYTWISSPYEKVSVSETDMAKVEHSLYMGRNEKEGFQISVNAEREREFTLKLKGGLPAGVTCDINKVYKTVNVKGELWADPIAPLAGGKISLIANSTETLYIELSTSKTTPAGKYTISFELKEGSKLICTYTVELTVWSITYSDSPTFKTTVGLNKYAIALEKGYISNYYHKIPDEYEDEVMELYLTYYEYMLDNRISPTQLPYDILDPRADKYMSDPRLTSFSVPTRYPTETRVWGDYISDDTLKAYYDKLCSNPEWLKKAYIYPVDEPTSKAHLDEILGQLERYKRIAPKLRVATSFFMNFNYGGGKDAVDVLTENLTMLSIKTCTFNGDDGRYGIAPVNGKTLSDRMKEYVSRGGEMWTYICWEPGDPYANMYVNEPGINHRLSMWQQYDLGAVGFLYWDCTYWECVGDPWVNMATVPWVSNDGISPVHGDGSLLYPGHKVGLYGPCGSVRFFAVRDGVEDVMLLKMAEELFGRQWVDAKIDKITRSVTDYTGDAELFDLVRVEIGNAVSNKNING